MDDLKHVMREAKEKEAEVVRLKVKLAELERGKR